MTLLIVVILAGVAAGYFFARSRYSKPVDEVASKVAATSQDYAEQTSKWTRSLFSRSSKAEQLRAWPSGPGASQLPEEFKTWLAGLTKEEADEFTRALDSYSSSLGYDLGKLVKGELNDQPERQKSFVEAIVSYNETYRKTRETRQDAGQVPEVPDEKPATADGKAPAEKAVSRRRSESGETTEPGTTD